MQAIQARSIERPRHTADLIAVLYNQSITDTMSNYPEQVRRRGKRCTTDVIEWLLGSVTDGGSNLFENDVEKLVAAAQICKDMGIRPPPDIEVKWNTSIADRKEITSWHVVHSKTAERVEQNERHAHFNERYKRVTMLSNPLMIIDGKRHIIYSSRRRGAHTLPNALLQKSNTSMETFTRFFQK